MANRGLSKLDTIFLRGLQVQAIIGIYKWERGATQTVTIDIDMATDVARAAAADSIDAAVNYKKVAKRLIAFTESSQFALVETLAESLARIIVTEFEVPSVRLSVSKPGAIEGSSDVGVTIERSRASYD
jgi:dihydroneopterin aldolase